MAALKDPDSVFHYYQKLIALRKQYPVIVHGKYRLLLEDDPDLFVYTREFEGEKLLVVCSFTEEEREISLPEEFKEAQCLIGNYPDLGDEGKEKRLVRPYEAFVYFLRQ